MLFVFLVLSNDRRRISHFNVTAHPTAEWTAQQLIEALGFDENPQYLIRNSDGGVQVIPADGAPGTDTTAKLHRSGESYELQVDPRTSV